VIATSETVVGVLIDSAQLRADVEALLDAIRHLEQDTAEAEGEFTRVLTRRLEKMLERKDLLTQSYVLAKARAAQGQGGGR
jgi:hypothetical protein